jgi:hypothetical protein
LSDEAIDQISLREAINADAIEPICNLQFVCSCWARKEKQKAKMLYDLSNYVGRGLQKKCKL